MIVPRALTDDEQNRAQRIFCGFTGIAAVAGNCSGATIQVLMAVSLGIGSAWVSGIGALVYLSYLFLPAGFKIAGRLGVGLNIRYCQWMSSLMCLVIASSCVIPAGKPVCFFAGVLLMYMSSACGASMNFPLEKNITTDRTIHRLLSRTQMIASSVGLIVSLSIAWVLSVFGGAAVLPLLFCIAAAVYFCNGLFIARIPEPVILKKLALRPVLPQVRNAWRDAVVRKQLLTGLMLNMTLATMVSVNILTIKKGCGLNDHQAMILTVIQTVTTIGGSWVFKVFMERFGPRKMMLCAYPLVWALALYWCLIPAGCPLILLAPPFVAAGFLCVFFSTSLNSYFAISVPNPLQIGGTFLVFIITGGLVGVLSVILNPLIFKLTELYPASDSMTPFRLYYMITGVLSLPGIRSVVRLPVKYLEYRAAHPAEC